MSQENAVRRVAFAGRLCRFADALRARLRAEGAEVVTASGDLAHPADRGAAALEAAGLGLLVLDATAFGRLPESGADAATWGRGLSGLAGLARDLGDDLADGGGRCLLLFADPAALSVLAGALEPGPRWLAVDMPADLPPAAPDLDLLCLLCGPAGDGLGTASVLRLGRAGAS